MFVNNILFFIMEVKKKGAIFWGLTRGLKHSIENLHSHLFDVLKENNIDYDIFIKKKDDWPTIATSFGAE